MYYSMALRIIQRELAAKTPLQKGSHSSLFLVNEVKNPPKMRPIDILIGIRRPPSTSIEFILKRPSKALNKNPIIRTPKLNALALINKRLLWALYAKSSGEPSSN